MKGVLFDNTHSYRDLNLILSDASIPPAQPKTCFVDIPGGDGSVDLTEALGEVRYSDRSGTFTFTCFPADDFEEKKREVSNIINGRRLKIVLDKDPEYYWIGRCMVDEYRSNKRINTIVVSATVAPYKLRKETTVVTVPAGESVSTGLTNGRKSVVPTITSSADTTIVFGENTYKFSAGTHKNLGILLTQGDNEVIVTSTGTTEFSYQEGDL